MASTDLRVLPSRAPLPLAFGLLGIAILLPWNSFITAVDYFSKVFPGSHCDRVFSLLYLVCNIVSISASMHFRTGLSAPHRIVCGLVGYIAALLVVPIGEIWMSSTSSGHPVYYGAILCSVALAGLCDGFAQPALYGEAGMVSQECVQAVTVGVAGSGMVVALLRLMSKAVGGDTFAALRASALIYFGIAIVFCALCVVLYAVVACGAKHQLGTVQRTLYTTDLHCSSSKSTGSQNIMVAPHVLEADVVPVGQATGAVVHDSDYACDLAAREEDGQVLLDGILSPGSTHHLHGELRWRHMMGPATSIFVVYALTLAIFPGFIGEDVSSATLGSWYPIWLFATFGGADFASRWIRVPDHLLGTLALSRLFFLPAFGWAAHTDAHPAFIFFLTIWLGLSNGSLTNTSFLAATAIAGPQNAERCGNIMVLSLMGGLVVGSLCSFLWLAI